MVDEPFRKYFARLTGPLVARLARTGITPNQVTVLSFVVALGGAGGIALGSPRAGFVLWIASRVGDGLDGALARATGRRSPFGGYLDITLDMAAYSAMVLAFSRLYPSLGSVWLAVVAAYVLVITTTLALSGAAATNAPAVSATDRTFQFTPGIAEAGETSVMYGLWVALPGHVEWLAWLWVIMLLATCAQRTWLAWRVLSGESED